MGPETSAGCSQWAALVVGTYTARPAWRALSAAWSGRDADVASLGAAALGTLVAASLVTFGLYQMLAAALAGRARKVDVHRAVGPSASDPGPLGVARRRLRPFDERLETREDVRARRSVPGGVCRDWRDSH